MSSRGFHYGVADLLVNETSCSVFNSFCLCTIICARFHYCASNHLYLILNRSGSVCASLSLGCSTTPQSYRVPMNDISRGDVFNNFSLKSRRVVAGFLLISTTLVIYIRRRKVNLIDIYGGHFVLFGSHIVHSFLLCKYCNFKAASANKIKLTPLGVIDVQLLRDSEPIRLLETPKTLSEYKSIGHIFQLCSCSISPAPGSEVKSSANPISAGCEIRH